MPPIAVFLSKHPIVSNFDVSSLKDVISAAAPLGKDTQDALISRLGVSVRQGNIGNNCNRLNAVPYYM